MSALAFCFIPLKLVAKACRALALSEAKCAEKGWTVLGLAIQPDHVHLFDRCIHKISGIGSYCNHFGFSTFTCTIPSTTFTSNIFSGDSSPGMVHLPSRMS